MSKHVIYGRETWQQGVRFKLRPSIPLGFQDIRGVKLWGLVLWSLECNIYDYVTYKSFNIHFSYTIRKRAPNTQFPFDIGSHCNMTPLARVESNMQLS